MVKSCPVCLSKGEFVFLNRWENYNILYCPECSVTFSNPMRAADRKWYESTYNERELQPSLYSDRQTTWEHEEFINNCPLKSGKLMEIGCGEGYFLDMAQSRGYAIVGIDINKQAIHRAANRGFDVYAMTIDDYSRQYNHIVYDMVCFFHVLEHVDKPRRFMCKVNFLLRKNGYIFFSVPNQNRIGRIFKKESWDYPPHHLTSWTKNSLKTLLESSGFEIESFKDEPLRLLKELPVLLPGTAGFGLNRTIEKGVYRTRKHEFLQFILKTFYRFFTIVKKIFFTFIAYITYPWYFLTCRDKTGGSLLVIAKKIR